ncbi:unnamed protein product [Caenorhabditis sp. 36 PRJEB53466]|nr:unnamed protein product [Caenorhabditis sp. 36 PRJEB53466]
MDINNNVEASSMEDITARIRALLRGNNRQEPSLAEAVQVARIEEPGKKVAEEQLHSDGFDDDSEIINDD